jgi:phage shock protein B
MNSVIIVAIVFGSILTFAAIVCGTILATIKMRRSGLTSGDRKTQTDEAKVIQEIYQGLTRMEERIEALETILMEGQEKDGKKR